MSKFSTRKLVVSISWLVFFSFLCSGPIILYFGAPAFLIGSCRVATTDFFIAEDPIYSLSDGLGGDWFDYPISELIETQFQNGTEYFGMGDYRKRALVVVTGHVIFFENYDGIIPFAFPCSESVVSREMPSPLFPWDLGKVNLANVSGTGEVHNLRELARAYGGYTRVSDYIVYEQMETDGFLLIRQGKYWIMLITK